MPISPPPPARPGRVHIDLTTLQIFIATAELGGVTRAADRLHIAVAAASRRIVDLEAQFGLPLFERRPHGMTLTEAGRSMLAHARSITHTVSRMQDEAASYLGGEQGVVRVAAPKSAVIQFLPQDMQRCAQRCPGVRIDLQEMNSQLVQQALQRGSVDIGIYEGTLGAIDMPTRSYRVDRLVAITPHDHPLAGRAAVTLDDLLGFDLIGLGEGSAIAIMLERLANDAGRILRMPMRVGGFDSIAALVAQGLGVGVMPKAVARGVSGGKRFAQVALSEDWAARRFVLCHRRDALLSGAARAVAEVFAESAPRSRKANPGSRNEHWQAASACPTVHVRETT